MSYSFIANAAAASTNTIDVTTPAFDSTGADLLVAVVALYSQSGDAVDGDMTDNKGNTLTFRGKFESAANTEVAMYWTRPTTVGSGHTVTFARGSAFTYPALAVAAFSGSATSPLGSINGNNGGSGQNILAGLIPTPPQDGVLLVTGVAVNGAVTIDGVAMTSGTPPDYAITDVVDYVNPVNLGVGLAYKIQATAEAEDATWALSGTMDRCALHAVFLPAAAVAPRRFLLMRH